MSAAREDAARGAPDGALVAAVSFAAAWGALLALLAALWIRTPFSGPGPMFVAWSVPALVLTLLSARWLRGLGVRQVRVTGPRVAAVLALWAVAALAALLLADLAAELVLDGFVLRRPLRRAGGLALAWLPGAFGLLLSTTGLVAALEARYRIAQGEVGSLVHDRVLP